MKTCKDMQTHSWSPCPKARALVLMLCRENKGTVNLAAA